MFRFCLRLIVFFIDERFYKCVKCGKSFRESGVLIRYFKFFISCIEKIRFSMSKDMVIGKEEIFVG